MRRRYLVIGLALISLSAAAAVAILPQNGDGTGKPFMLADLWSLADNGQAPPSGNSGAPPQKLPVHQQSDPFNVIDLPFDSTTLYVTDLSDGALADDPASEPVGGEGQPPKGGGKSNDPENTKGTANDDPLGSIPGSGYFVPNGGGGFTRLASNERPADQGVTGDKGAGSDAGEGGSGGAGEPNRGAPNSTDHTNDLIDTDGPAAPISIDEPAPLSLLLIGGLALLLARRAKRASS